jgi:hypothetical protein
MDSSEDIHNQIIAKGNTSELVDILQDLPNSKERISKPELFVCPWDNQHGDTTYFR